MLQNLRNLAIAILMSILSASFVLAADEKNGTREIGDGVYSFTLGEGNHSMFVIGEDGVAVFETFHSGHSQKLLDAAPPDITWSGDRKDFDMGDFTVSMHYLGLSHGMGLTIFAIPERNAAYIADLVSPNRVMFSVVPDFNIGEWERADGSC